MKKTIIVFFLFLSNSFSQVDTTALSFYPLKTGNYWEYKKIVYEDTLIFDENYVSVSIIGDTLLTNGHNYKIFKKQNINNSIVNYYFERLDSLTGNVYRYYENNPDNNNEYLIDSLKSQIGDSCSSQRVFYPSKNPITILMSERFEPVFNHLKSVKYYYHVSIIPGYSYKLAKNLGLYDIIYGGEIRSIREIMTFAQIDGKEYGMKNQNRINKDVSKLKSFQLNQNYPNPFNNCTTIAYSIELPGIVTLEVNNVRGQKITSLYKNHDNLGDYTFILDSQDLSSGVYFISLTMNGFSERRKMLLLR